MKTIRRMLMVTGFLSILTAGLILVEPKLLTYIAAIYLAIFGIENIVNAYKWKNLK